MGERYSTDADVARCDRVGKKYFFGDGLYLQVTGPSAKSWLFRYTLNGKQRWYGIGSANELSVSRARIKVGGARCEVEENGIDIVAQRRLTRGTAKIYRAHGVVTFRDAAERCIENKRSGWSNAKHAAQWEASLKNYVYPRIGDIAVAGITRDHIIDILRPIWILKRETANRLRGRIEDVLVHAMAKGWRAESLGNPASLSKLFRELLPKRPRKPQAHHAALSHPKVSGFMEGLLKRDGVTPQALAFTILTAARTTETTAARWAEIDFGGKVWTVPRERMKMRLEHRVPLSDAAIAVLRRMESQRESEFIFPGAREGQSLSNMAMLKLAKELGARDRVTTHGFRATFRTWSDECGVYFSEAVKELALAHVNDDETRAAYARSDYYEERRKLMELWGTYCTQMPGGDGATAGNVVKLRKSLRQ